MSKYKKKNYEDYCALAYSRPEKVMFLDIETTGFSFSCDYVTCAGWIMNGSYNYWLQGTDEKEFFSAFNDASLIVTFNGTSFDCKFLDRAFDTNIFSEKLNLDLLHFCRRLDLTGGQKNIEKIIGFPRPEIIKEVDGFMAVHFWNGFIKGRNDFLSALLLYNFYDVLGMCYILDYAAKKPESFYNSSLPKKKIIFPPKNQCEKIRDEVKKRFF